MMATLPEVNFAINCYPRYFFCIHINHNDLRAQKNKKKCILSYILKNLIKSCKHYNVFAL